MADRPVLFTLRNRHGDSSQVPEPAPGSYVSYFENELGEQWVFVREPGEPSATIWGGDAGWEPHEVRYRSTAQVRESAPAEWGENLDWLVAMCDPHVPTLVLGEAEKAWVTLAWWTSCAAAEREQQTEAIAADLAARVQADDNINDPRTALTALVFQVGVEAGRRGMDAHDLERLHTAALARYRESTGTQS
jgi:hypothetical protein